MFDSLREAGDDLPFPFSLMCHMLYGWLIALFILPLVAYRLIRLWIFCVYFLGNIIYANVSELGKYLWRRIRT